MKMDVALFAKLIQEAPESVPPSARLQTKERQYLVNTVLTPLAQDKDVLLRDIDFSAFQLSDIEAIQNFVSEEYGLSQKNRMLEQLLAQLKPVSGTGKIFF